MGIIQHYRRDKGFGFVRSANRPADIFFHITEFHGNPELLRTGLQVEFSLGERKGKPVARDVWLLEADEPHVAVCDGGAS